MCPITMTEKCCLARLAATSIRLISILETILPELQIYTTIQVVRLLFLIMLFILSS
jgi:hypothetical protein